MGNTPTEPDARSSRADERTRVLKHGDTFGVFDRYGDVHPIGLGEQGLFHEPGGDDAIYSDILELDLSTVVPSLAGPKRPQDRIALTEAADYIELPAGTFVPKDRVTPGTRIPAQGKPAERSRPRLAPSAKPESGPQPREE